MGASAFCACECTQWVIVAFVLGSLIGILIMVIADKLETTDNKTDS